MRTNVEKFNIEFAKSPKWERSNKKGPTGPFLSPIELTETAGNICFSQLMVRLCEDFFSRVHFNQIT